MVCAPSATSSLSVQREPSLPCNRDSGHTRSVLSVLDEPDESARPPRRGGGAARADRQTLMARRSLALGAGLIVLILLVLGVRGCVNARQ